MDEGGAGGGRVSVGVGEDEDDWQMGIGERSISIWVGCEKGKGRSNKGGTYAPGHILVSTNKGVLCNAKIGLDGPKTLAKCNASHQSPDQKSTGDDRYTTVPGYRGKDVSTV